MLKQYNKISLRLGTIGFIMQSIAGVMWGTYEENNIIADRLLFLPVAVVGTALLVVGLGYYSIGKGRSVWWGFCGCLGMLGLVALFLLEDQAPNE